jgi:hypothetical protein
MGAVCAEAQDSNAPRAHPAVGTPVAAALETAGYVSQTKILKSMKVGLNRLGALLYIGCIISALLTVGLAGRYDMALWLLVGPPIFFFLINPGSTPGGTEWEFAQRGDELRQRDRLLRSANINVGEGGQASWFFHNFNLITSDIAQQLMKLFTQSQARADQYFNTRQNISRDLFGSEIDDSDLMTVVAVTRALCVDSLHAAQLMAMGARNALYRNTEPTSPGGPNAYEVYKTEYCSRFTDEKDQKKGVPDGPAKQYLLELLKKNENVADTLSSMSCKQMWIYMLQAVHAKSKQSLGVTLSNRIPPATPAEDQEKIIQDVLKKVTAENWDRDGADPVAAECPADTGAGIPSGTTREKLERVFTAWTLRKLFEQDFRGPMIASLRGEHDVGEEQAGYYNFQGKQAAYEMTRRATVHQKTAAMPYEIYFMMNSLPYVQGIGLYALAVVFPFFAVLVLMPGMAGSFFMWCALWIWLKSWDVGWALVMVADDVLWDLMPHNTFFRETGSASDLDPPNILEAAFGGDYSYNLMTYYTLVAMMIGAVPVISANAVLGSKRAVAGIMLDGIKTMASNLSNHVEDHVRTLQLGEIDRAKQDMMGMKVGTKIGGLSDALKGQEDGYTSSAVLDGLYMDALEEGAKPAALVKTAQSLTKWWRGGLSEGMKAAKEEYEANLKALCSDPEQIAALRDILAKNRFVKMMLHFKNSSPGISDEQAFEMAKDHMINMLDLQQPALTAGRALDTAMGALKKLNEASGGLSAEAYSALQQGVGDKGENKTQFMSALSELDQHVKEGRFNVKDRDAIALVKGDQHMASAIANLAKYHEERNAKGVAGPVRDANGLVIDPILESERIKTKLEEKGMQRYLELNEHTRATRQLLEGYLELQMAGVMGLNLKTLDPKSGGVLPPTVLGFSTEMLTKAALGDIKVGMDARTLSQSLVFQDLVVSYKRTEYFQAQNLLNMATHYYNFEASKTEQWRFTEMVRAGISGREEWWNVPEAPVMVGPAADMAASLSQEWLARYGIRAEGHHMRANLDALPKVSK